MKKYRNLKTILSQKIKDEKIPFNNKIFIWFISLVFFNFFVKKRISNDAAYFDYLFTNNISKDHSVLSDVVSRVGWIALKEKLPSSYLKYDIPDNDIPNQQFFSQTRKMQGVAETGPQNIESDLLQIEEYKNNSTYSQPGSFVPLIYDTNPLEDNQFIEKKSSIYRLHWISFAFSLLLYILEVFLLFILVFFSLDFYIYFDGFCWNILELSIQYPSRFIWLNLDLGSYQINIYDILPFFFKVLVIFLWHLWYYSKFLFCVFFFVFLNFIYTFLNFSIILFYNFYLKVTNLNVTPSSEGYFGDFSYMNFTEIYPEFSNKGSSLFRSLDNNLGVDTPVGEATNINRGHVEDEELANEFFIFYKDKDSILKMRPLTEFLFFFKSFVLIFCFFFWYIVLFLFIIFTFNYFFFSIFRFIIYNDVYKYTVFNYIFGHINMFPILDWFYQFEVNLKKIYNQRFFLERYTNYIFSKGYSKLHYFFIKKKECENLKLKTFFQEIAEYNKEILFPRRMKSKRYFYKSLTPYIPDIDKYFKNGIASKRILFDFVFFKYFTSFQNKIVFLSTKDNVNYFFPNKTRLWIINTRFKDFFTYLYDFITGSFFFSYVEFTNFKFMRIDDLTISRLLQVSPQDENLYNEILKKNVIYSLYFDIPTNKSDFILKHQNHKIVSDIFLEDFTYYGKSKSPEVFYSKSLYSKNSFALNKIVQDFYKYVFFFKNSYKKDYYNNLFRLNFKFEELFESLEHETDLFFDFSKRNLNAADLDSYLDFYWKQYTVLRDYKYKKIKTTMKINNFFIRSRLQFLKLFSKFDFVGTSFLFDSEEHRQLYDSFSSNKVKYLKKFLRFYGLFQFNSNLRMNKYLLTNNFFNNYDLIKFRYFKNLELWKIFQFRTSFQNIFNRLNTRSFLGYYCNNNNTFPFVEYRDHFKSSLRTQPTTWIGIPYREEKEGYGEDKFAPKKAISGFPMGFQKKVTPLNYVFYFDNDDWRNYKYNFKQRILDNSPKFLASSSYFGSYYFLTKYLPKNIFKNDVYSSFIYNNNLNKKPSSILFFFKSFYGFILWFKNKIFFLFLTWQWIFFFFIIYIFNFIIDDSSFNYKYTSNNIKKSLFFFNFLISFFIFVIICFFFFSFLYGLIKTINYLTNDLVFYFFDKTKTFLIKHDYNFVYFKWLKINFLFCFVFMYIFSCFLFYYVFFSNFFFTYNKSSLKLYNSYQFFDFSMIKIDFTKLLKKKNDNVESKIFNNIDQISFYKTYKISKNRKK